MKINSKIHVGGSLPCENNSKGECANKNHWAKDEIEVPDLAIEMLYRRMGNGVPFEMSDLEASVPNDLVGEWKDVVIKTVVRNNKRRGLIVNSDGGLHKNGTMYWKGSVGGT